MATKISKVVGIDLGTTNSVISMMGPDNKTILCNTDAQGRRTFPSAIVWDKRSGTIKSGQLAFNRRGTIPEPITSIKRRMGDLNYRAKTGEAELSPIEVSAEILREMKSQMQEYLSKIPGCENYVVDRAVITIPAYFRSEASESTAKAGEMAGLQVVKTLQEPSSASAYYCWKNNIEDGTFMVYDLGGGTFDVSIIEYAAGDASVKGIAGNNYLGGDTFDELLARMILEALQEEGYILELQPDDEKDVQRMTKLKLVAEVIKKALSDKEEHYHTHDGIFVDQEGATVNLAITVMRSDFEALIEPVLSGTLEKCQEALEKAAQSGITLDQIDGVILVGGSTHIPFVQEFVRRHFCDPSLPMHTKNSQPFHEDPDMAVGFGAAVTAASFPEITMEEVSDEDKNSESIILAAEVKPGIGVGGKSTVIGTIRAVQGKLPQGLIAKVMKADGSFQAEFPIDETGGFKFTKLPAPGEDEPYYCSVGKGETEVFSFKFNAAEIATKSAPSTLSHPLYVMTQDVATGKRSMRVLMEEGKNLPASGDYSFKTTQEYSATVRVIERNTVLCDIVLHFENAVPIGTPVNVRLEIDEKSTKHVYATAAGQSQDAYLEASQETIEAKDVQEKLNEFQSILRILPREQQILAKAQTGKIQEMQQEALQAVQEADQVRAREVFDEMSSLIEKFQQQKIEPPEAQFQLLVQECMRLNYLHHQNDPRNAEEIQGHQERAAEHYRKMNQEGVTVEYSALVDLYQMLMVDTSAQSSEEKWQITKRLCEDIRVLMRMTEENPKLPIPLRKQSESEKLEDLPKVNAADKMMTPYTSNEEAVQEMTKLRPILQRWQYYAEYDDMVG